MLSSKVILGLEHDWQALFLIHRFGWLRAHEIARFLWPNNDSQSKYGERLVRKLVDKKMLLQRRLPHRAGAAYVLSKLGAEHLQAGGIENARTGKDIGSVSGDQWTAPRDWRHSLLVSGFLGLRYEHAHFNEIGFEFLTELEIKQNFSRSEYIDKVPDALFLNDDGWTWLEVENSRKSGQKHMGGLAQSLIEIYNDQPSFFGKPCTEIAIAYPEDSLNEFGHQVNHYLRITNAVSGYLSTDDRIWIDFYGLQLRGFAAVHASLAQESISGRKAGVALAPYESRLQQEDWDVWDEEYGDQYNADYDLFDSGLAYHKLMVAKFPDATGKLHWKFIRDERGIRNANPSARPVHIEYEGFSSSIQKTEKDILKIIQAAKDGTLKPQNPAQLVATPHPIESPAPAKETGILGRFFGKK